MFKKLSFLLICCLFAATAFGQTSITIPAGAEVNISTSPEQWCADAYIVEGVLTTYNPSAVCGADVSGGGTITLPVELTSFNAQSTQEGIRLTWRTESEINNAGFYLYRDDVKLNVEMIAGQGTTTIPKTYTYLDETVKAGETYVYQISDVEEYTLKETFHNEIEITYTPPSEDNEVVKPAPSSYALHDCYPNPFNPITTITFDLPEPVHVNLGIYDAQGQLVKTLIDGEKAAGSHPVQWDGTDGNGDVVSSGVYYYTITTDNFELNETKSMVLMK